MRIILFLTIVVFAACSRTEIHHKIGFKGFAVDYYTHYPVKNALIQVYEEYEHPSGRSDESRTGEGETDENGNFDFKTKGVHKDKYVLSRYLLFTGPGVNASWYSGQFMIGDVENRNEYEAKLYTLSRLKFVVVNSTPFDQNDVISNFYIERPWGNQEVGNGSESLTGTSVNATLWSAYYGYTESILHYSVTKNSITQNYTDTILTPDPVSDIWVTDTISY